MCLKVIENGKHKDVHIKEGEVSPHSFSVATKTRVYLSLCSKVRKSDKLGHNKINIVWKVMVPLFCVALLLLVCFSVLKGEFRASFI